MSRAMPLPWVAQCRCGREVVARAPRNDGAEGRWVRCAECDHINHTREKYDVGEAVEEGLLAP